MAGHGRQKDKKKTENSREILRQGACSFVVLLEKMEVKEVQKALIPASKKRSRADLKDNYESYPLKYPLRRNQDGTQTGRSP